MGLLFVLNQRHLPLAVAESKAAVYGWEWWKHHEEAVDGTIYFSGARVPKRHLGLTRSIIAVLASCEREHLEKTIASINWNKVIGKKSYRVVASEDLRTLAKAIWSQLKQPNVNLKNPEITIDIIIVKNIAYIGLRSWENNDDFESRRTHLLASPHPSGTHPMIARALLHLTCATRIHDPLCGGGGWLIEAGLAGARVSGADIEHDMVIRTKKNCLQFSLHPEVRVADATQWIPRVTAIIADMPYGKSTRPKDTQELLEHMLARAAQSTSRALIGAAETVCIPSSWVVRAEFSLYTHKTMTRQFYLLERRRSAS